MPRSSPIIAAPSTTPPRELSRGAYTRRSGSDSSWVALSHSIHCSSDHASGSSGGCSTEFTLREPWADHGAAGARCARYVEVVHGGVVTERQRVEVDFFDHRRSPLGLEHVVHTERGGGEQRGGAHAGPPTMRHLDRQPHALGVPLLDQRPRLVVVDIAAVRIHAASLRAEPVSPPR